MSIYITVPPPQIFLSFYVSICEIYYFLLTICTMGQILLRYGYIKNCGMEERVLHTGHCTLYIFVWRFRGKCGDNINLKILKFRTEFSYGHSCGAVST